MSAPMTMTREREYALRNTARYFDVVDNGGDSHDRQDLLAEIDALRAALDAAREGKTS